MIVGWALAAMCLGAGDAHPAAAESLANALSEEILRAQPEPPLALAVTGPQGEPVLTMVAARLAQAHLAPAAITCGKDCDAQALASGARTLVHVSVHQGPKTLIADGELHGVWRNFWAGAREVRPPKPAAVLHAEATGASELPNPEGTPPVPLGAPELVAQDLATLPTPVEALGAADLDGDGTDELLVLTSDALFAFDRGGHPIARHPLDEVARAEFASRDPLGTIAVLPSPLSLLVFSQTRANGERLSWDAGKHTFVVSAALASPELDCSGQLFPVAFTPGENTFEPVRPPGPFAAVPQRTAALACRLSANGGFFAAVSPSGGARIQSPVGNRSVTGVGAGVAWVDVDGDGTPELASSSALLEPQLDTLTVTRLRTGTVETLPVPGRVLQIAALRIAGRSGEAMVLARAKPDGTTVLTRVQEEPR